MPNFFDPLTIVLLLLTAFLFANVYRYAARYMQGDPAKRRFMVWLCITGSCVFAIILARDLLFFALAWCATSLSLHQLLQFYKDRPGAVLSARKKFLFSRVGDACLVAVLWLTRVEFGTWNFDRIFRLAAQPVPHLDAICVLLVFTALLKSAQFPFHSWLPDTMETPTPVSALMHAGIINAGGILVLRLSPLICRSEAALIILCLVGAFTALFASVVMLTQTSIKRCLAFSTVAQMGFMMLECGLGAFHLALLHLAAHSLYKAYAFLGSGGAVLSKKRPALAAMGPLKLVLSFAVSAVFLGVHLHDEFLLFGIFALGIAQLLWIDLSVSSLVLGFSFGALYSFLERAAAGIVPPYPWPHPLLSVAILLSFLIVTLLQTQIPRLSRNRLGQRIYVAARNGFYINTLANRLTAAMWPVSENA